MVYFAVEIYYPTDLSIPILCHVQGSLKHLRCTFIVMFVLLGIKTFLARLGTYVRKHLLLNFVVNWQPIVKNDDFTRYVFVNNKFHTEFHHFVLACNMREADPNAEKYGPRSGVPRSLTPPFKMPPGLPLRKFGSPIVHKQIEVMYTNRAGGLCQIYKLEAKPRFVYCF